MTMTSSLSTLRETWPNLSPPERVAAFEELPRTDAEQLVLGLDAEDQAELLL